MRVAKPSVLFSTFLGLSSTTRFVDGADRRTPSPDAPTNNDVVPNIYGGSDAEPGDFPYFAQFNGCGGALIAPDVALTAAHCNDYTGSDIYIGAYNDTSTANGAQKRTCATYIFHPYYNRASGLINDVALCKLDEIVTIDESEVRLELNRDDVDAFPIVGEELVAMGFGLLGYENLTTPDNLQRTTLEGRECGGFRPLNQVCAGGAGGADGVSDVCRGDSGGPLVKVVANSSGPDIHYHVGLVSSGALCPTATTGTYARTSAMVSWIDEALCQLNSVAAGDNCEDYNEEVECEGDESVLEINVATDQYASENKWILDRKMRKRDKWVEEAKNELELSVWPYRTVLCLRPETMYRWTFTDTFADGLTCQEGHCGAYSLTLNGEEIAAIEDGDLVDEVVKEFVTPASPRCEGDESTLEINVVTDAYANETKWILDKKKRRNKWEEETRNSLLLNDESYKTVLCLQPEETYRWSINDSYGDGLLCTTAGCGSYSVTLNGQEIVSNGTFEFELSEEFNTPACVDNSPDVCEDEDGRHKVVFDSGETKKKKCGYIERQIEQRGERRGKKLCKLPLADSEDLFMDACKKTCATVGLGDCAGCDVPE